MKSRRHDRLTKEQRSALMAKIRSRGTRIELLMEEALVGAKIDFTSHPSLFGKPDFALPMHKIVIFCDGDFWHGYNFGRNRRHDVKDNREFWKEKIRRNRLRDRLVNRRLRGQGWVVLRFWEHEVIRDPGRCLEKIRDEMTQRFTN